MFIKAIMIILLGILCLAGVVLSIIFTIISFANNKPQKFTWLASIFVFLIGLITCIILFVNKAVNKIKSVGEDFSNTIEQSMHSISDSLNYSYNNDALLETNPHLKKIRSYSANPDSIPTQFYTYLGFQNYFRFPLTYPYSLHCNGLKEDAELYNEKNVGRFDENDNGEVSTAIEHIDKIAFDKNFLLIDQRINSTRSANALHHYYLFVFADGTKLEVKSEKELFKLAKSKGYIGDENLITIEEYSLLFN